MKRFRESESVKILADELFAFVEDLGQLAADIALTPYGKLKINRYPHWDYYYRLRKYQKHGLLKKIKKNNQIVYVLTQKAKRLQSKPITKQSRTDGMSTIILFDIPEDKHRARDNFRRYLVRNGYTKIQKSVFISSYKIFDDLVVYIQELGIEDNVEIITGKMDRIY